MHPPPDSVPWISSVDLDALVVPDTPEHLWPSESPIDCTLYDTFEDSFVPETEFEAFVPESDVDCFGSEIPTYAPPATPIDCHPAAPVDPPPPPPFDDVEWQRKMLDILVPGILDLI